MNKILYYPCTTCYDRKVMAVRIITTRLILNIGMPTLLSASPLKARKMNWLKTERLIEMKIAKTVERTRVLLHSANFNKGRNSDTSYPNRPRKRQKMIGSKTEKSFFERNLRKPWNKPLFAEVL